MTAGRNGGADRQRSAGASAPRLLVIAPTDRDDIGEAWAAYQWSDLLSQHFEVTLLTYRKRGRPSAVPQLPACRVIEWAEPRMLGRFERLNSMMKPAWIPFYVRSRRWLRRALEGGEQFAAAFQPAPASLRYPSPVVGLGIPFVIGPVGGSLTSPPGFAGTDTAPWYVSMRRLDRIRLKRDPLLRATFEGAECVLGVAPYIRETLQDLRIRRFEVESQAGISGLPEPVDRSRRTGPVRLLFVGRLIRTKGARDVIAALGRCRDLPVVLDIVGDGFDRAACEELVRALGLTESVRFHGKVDHVDVWSHYERADIFAFPSYQEPGGNVVLEAMASGLPLIVADRGGPASAVDDSCAIRVQPRTPDQYAEDIADAVRLLVGSRELRLSMGASARSRVAERALWSNKIARVTDLLTSIAAS
jgi:glycosyltransferase involved in cell wall biosynthesis